LDQLTRFGGFYFVRYLVNKCSFWSWFVSVVQVIVSVLQGIVSIPWYVIYIVKMIFTMSDGGATSSSVGLNFAQYLFSILMLYGSYLSAIFGIVGLVYQYGHASEVVDSITVESDIDNFDKL
jgi:hypothetical protein